MGLKKKPHKGKRKCFWDSQHNNNLLNHTAFLGHNWLIKNCRYYLYYKLKVAFQLPLSFWLYFWVFFAVTWIVPYSANFHNKYNTILQLKNDPITCEIKDNVFYLEGFQWITTKNNRLLKIKEQFQVSDSCRLCSFNHKYYLLRVISSPALSQAQQRSWKHRHHQELRESYNLDAFSEAKNIKWVIHFVLDPWYGQGLPWGFRASTGHLCPHKDAP